MNDSKKRDTTHPIYSLQQWNIPGKNDKFCIKFYIFREIKTLQRGTKKIQKNAHKKELSG